MKRLLTCILLTAILLSLFGCSEKNNVKSYDMKEEEFFNLLSRYADDAEMTLTLEDKDKKSVLYSFYRNSSNSNNIILNEIWLYLDKYGNISNFDIFLHYEYDKNLNKYVIPDDVSYIVNRLITHLHGKEPEDIWESSFPKDAPKDVEGTWENSRYDVHYYEDEKVVITFYAQ